MNANQSNQPFWDIPDLLDVPGLCGVLSISQKNAYALLKRGDIPHIKVGRAYRIPKKNLMEYLKLR